MCTIGKPMKYNSSQPQNDISDEKRSTKVECQPKRKKGNDTYEGKRSLPSNTQR